jgi:hypothetical protein
MPATQVVVNRDGSRTVVPDVGQLRYVRSPDHQHWQQLRFDAR